MLLNVFFLFSPNIKSTMEMSIYPKKGTKIMKIPPKIHADINKGQNKSGKQNANGDARLSKFSDETFILLP